MVEVGATEVDPLAEVEVKLPGVMLTWLAPLVVQLKLVVPPAVIVAGLPANDVMVGFTGVGAVTVTVAVEVTDPVLLVAVNVYVVVEVGATEVDPLVEVEVNVPGVIFTWVAPEVVQLRVALAPEVIDDGVAVKALMAGTTGVTVEGVNTTSTQ